MFDNINRLKEPAYKIKDLQAEAQRLMSQDALHISLQARDTGGIQATTFILDKEFVGIGLTASLALMDLTKTIEIFID
jgi:hypothetical protein